MKKSAILLYILVIIFSVSVVYKYRHFVVNRDFIVSSQISCDKTVESCFVWGCSPEEEDECDQTPYKYIYKNARFASACNPYHDECPELSCGESEPECEIISCSEETVDSEEVCVFDPVETPYEHSGATGQIENTNTGDVPIE